MAEMVEQQQQNVVVRLINLPLVSSTYDMVSSTYVTTKDNHPYLKSVCDVAEKSVKTITSVAWTSAMPILQRLEPQIAMANSIACIGLDKIEEKLPILYQPPEKIVSSASEAVVGAKDAVVQSITGVVDKTKGAVQGSVEMTKAVVNGSINTVLGSSVVKIMSSRVDTALTKSETLLEQYLPATDEELAKEATKTEGFDVAKDQPNYYVRLGSLSTKARTRAYQQALTRMKDAKCRSQEAIAQLQITVDLQIESRTLTIARNLAQLQTTCVSLVLSAQGLPQNIQNKAQNACAMAADVYENFRSAYSFREMSDSFLTTTKDQFTQMKDSMDDLMDYVVNNTPLNWLVPDLSINDLASETDDNPDVFEEEMQDFSRANGRVINGE